MIEKELAISVSEKTCVTYVTKPTVSFLKQHDQFDPLHNCKIYIKRAFKLIHMKLPPKICKKVYNFFPSF